MLYDDGLSITMIAVRFGVSRELIWKGLKNNKGSIDWRAAHHDKDIDRLRKQNGRMAQNSHESSHDRAAHLKEHRFKPGQGGNPGGRPRKRPITDRYLERIEQLLPERLRRKYKLPKGSTYGDAIALGRAEDAIIKTYAARELREAIEGKATQRLEIGTGTRAPTLARHRDAVVNLQTMVPKENPLRHPWQDEEGQNLLGNALLGRVDRPSGGGYGHRVRTNLTWF